MDIIRKNFERIKNSLFDYPVISTNYKYINEIKKRQLKKHGIRKYRIILEPIKKNTAPAILSSILIKEIPDKQPIIFLSADHLIDKVSKFNREIKKIKNF